MMALAILFLTLAGIVFCASPVLLSSGRWQARRPNLALNSWLAVLAIGLLLSAAALGALVWAAVRAELFGVRMESLVPVVGGWLALGAAGGVLALVMRASDDFGRRENAEAQALRSRWTDWYIDSPFRIVTVDGPEPSAYSLAGRPPEICLSVGLRSLLDEDECSAVIAHEKSHLSRHHSLVLRVAAVNSACLPRRLLMSRRFKASVLTLLEMIADDDAVRATSAASVQKALAALGDAGRDDYLRLRSLRIEKIHASAR